MASVTVSLGAKTLVVKVTPGKTLAEVLQEFAVKFDLLPELWSLAQKNKVLDLALPWRLTGLPQNAKLDVVKRPAAAAAAATGTNGTTNIGLQFADGSRIVLTVPLSSSLWGLLVQAETAKATNLTTFANKQGNYAQPVVAIMNKEISTNKELRWTTLEGLGMTAGSSNLIRVQLRDTTVPLQKFLESDKASIAEEVTAKEQSDRERSTRLEKAKQEEEAQRQREQEAKERVKANEAVEAAKISELQKQAKEYAQQLGEERLKRVEAQIQKKAEEEARAAAEHRARQRAHQQQSKPVFDPNTFWDGAGQTPEAQAAPGGPTLAQREANIPRVISLNPQLPRVGLEDKMDVDTEIGKLNSVPTENIDREPKVFAPSETPFDPATIELPDDFYEVTPTDMAVEMQAIKDKKNQQEAAVMRTKAQRERDRLKRLAKFKKCFVRIRFPDRIELQGTFFPQELTEQIRLFVKSCLNQPDIDFYLYTAPPITRLSETANLRDQGFLPAALVHVGIAQGAQVQLPFLRPELLQDLKEKVAHTVVYTPATTMNFQVNTTWGGGGVAATSTSSAEKQARIEAEDDEDKEKKQKAVPKWFAAGQRKK